VSFQVHRKDTKTCKRFMGKTNGKDKGRGRNRKEGELSDYNTDHICVKGEGQK
jgi:hypothetical protein